MSTFWWVLLLMAVAAVFERVGYISGLRWGEKLAELERAYARHYWRLYEKSVARESELRRAAQSDQPQ